MNAPGYTCEVCTRQVAKSQMHSTTLCKSCYWDTTPGNEFVALQKCTTILGRLGPDEVRRVVTYLTQRFEPQH